MFLIPLLFLQGHGSPAYQFESKNKMTERQKLKKKNYNKS